MEHKDYKEWLVLSSYGELGADEQVKLDGHLAECSECRLEQRELSRLHELLDRKPSDVSPDHVKAAREQLFRLVALDRQRTRTSAQMAAPGWSFGLRLAASVALMAVGLGMGYVLFGATPTPATGEYAGDPFASGDIHVQNVRFQETDPASGEVELSFYASRPVTLRGAVDDPKIQRLLAYALVNEQNPGVRLQAADVFRSQAAAGPDREVRNALIAALRSDTNDGVRTKAIQALAEYRVDDEVKSALLRVLRYDENPRLRIEAIHLLEGSLSQGQTVDDNFREVLENRSESDDNNYIRLRAKAVLQEVSYQ